MPKFKYVGQSLVRVDEPAAEKEDTVASAAKRFDSALRQAVAVLEGRPEDEREAILRHAEDELGTREVFRRMLP